jgi:cyclohexadienyl dehydratase
MLVSYAPDMNRTVRASLLAVAAVVCVGMAAHAQTGIVNPGGTNERFVRQNLKQARIEVYPDNVTIFDQLLQGKADLMIAESIETKVQEKLHPGLCSINPDQPLQYGEMGYLLPKGDIVFKDFVDQWLHLAKASGEFGRIYDQFVK